MSAKNNNDTKRMTEPKSEKVLTQKCVYYNGQGKCAFSNQSKCVYENGMVPFPYSCGVERQAEDEAMFGGEE